MPSDEVLKTYEEIQAKAAEDQRLFDEREQEEIDGRARGEPSWQAEYARMNREAMEEGAALLAREEERDRRYFFLTNPPEAGGSTVPVPVDKDGVPLETVRLQRNPDGSISDQAPVAAEEGPVLQKTAVGEFWADLTSKNRERFVLPSDREAMTRAARVEEADRQFDAAEKAVYEERRAAEEHPFLKASRERLEPESWANQEQRRLMALQTLFTLQDHNMSVPTTSLESTLAEVQKIYEWLRSGTLPGHEVPNAFKEWGS